MSGEQQMNDSRPTERFSQHGGFVPGVVTHLKNPVDLAKEGDIPCGIVLSTSATLARDERFDALTNVAGGRPDEHLGAKGGFTPGNPTFAGGPPRDWLSNITDHGVVLATSEKLHPAKEEPETNVAGGRPDERHGAKGGFTPGKPTLAGGPPRDIPVMDVTDHGIVLRTTTELSVDPNADDGTVNERGERVGRHGGFHHGVVEFGGGPLQMSPTTADAVAGEPKGWRRGGGANFEAGVTVLMGGAPKYDQH
ncbi:unnamed protein product [Phaeothamnion confervicola]